MVVDVELGIIGHRRLLESEGDLERPLAERGHQVDTIGHQVPDAPEVHPPGHGGGVEDQRPEDVEVGGG